MEFPEIQYLRASISEEPQGITSGWLPFPKVNGMMLVLAALFCSPAGYLGGKLHDLYHSYNLAFELNSLVAAGGIFAFFFARMAVPPEMKIPPELTGVAQAE